MTLWGLHGNMGSMCVYVTLRLKSVKHVNDASIARALFMCHPNHVLVLHVSS